MKTNLLLILFLICAPLLNAKVIKVPQDYTKIQSAITAAVNGDTVLVSEGTYIENLIITKKITVASLYLIDKDTSHISKTVLDGSTFATDSASVILILPGTDSTTVIKGLTIQNGRGTLLTFSILGNPNTYRFGGGIAIIANGGATISTNTIKNNSCKEVTSGVNTGGGGIAIYPDVNLTIGPNPWVIENNTIITNNVSASTGVTGGAGLDISGHGRVINNIIKNNSASGSAIGLGGGIVIYGAPGEQSIELSNNLIKSNSINNWGGGIEMHANAGLGSPVVTLKNNIIASNSAGQSGGGIYVDGGNYSLINNTITSNGGGSNEAIYLEAGAGPLTFRLMNNIIWNPAAGVEFNTTSNVSSSYNCVRDSLAGTGNISANPLFVANDSLYRISNASPCIGAGVLSASIGGSTLLAPTLDFLGNSRPRPSNTKPDLGAIESDLSTGVNEQTVVGFPISFALSQNYPNPFNPSTMINYQLAMNSFVTLRVFDILGRDVATLVNEQRLAGSYSVQWNAERFSSGVYFYKLEAHQKDGGHAASFSETKKLLLLK